jgi:hypothetical protein
LKSRPHVQSKLKQGNEHVDWVTNPVQRRVQCGSKIFINSLTLIISKMLKKTICLSLLALFLQSCGTVSKPLNYSNRQEPASINFSKYEKIILRDFEDKSGGGAKSEMLQQLFPNRISDSVGSENGLKIIRSNSDNDGLVVEGFITRYEEGNSFLRALIGFGAGRSHLFADVNFIDGFSKKGVAVIEVRKSSWLLGGGIAASQTPELLMEDAVIKIASEIKEQKQFYEVSKK